MTTPRQWNCFKTAAIAISLVIAAMAVTTQAQEATLKLEKGDRICILGNTFADRMQHFGWFETLLQARFPKHELYIRNLGFSGDTLTTRLRSLNFGTPESHLKANRANVVFLMFGYNESYAGKEGLEKFKADLAAEIRKHAAQKYDGEHNARVVVVSPIAHERLDDPNLPDPRENNRRLEMYTQAMQDVSRELNTPFVDLFHATQALYQQSDQPLTINGIHPNENGYRLICNAMFNSLFGTAVEYDAQRLAQIRRAVLDKNFYWYNYHRTVDGYSIFGGRADLKFVNGQTNREVMQREMEILKLMAENRDPAIWAAAQGQTYTVDDSNTPDFIPVITNKPGTGPNGEHVFLSGEEAVQHMRLLDGFEVNLFASEEMFPELINPVQMAFDTKGRLWVAAWKTYPHWKPKTEMDDRLLILEDLDGDGRADTCKTFATGLHNPTGFEFWGNGVIVAMAPEILYLEDTDGDDVADRRTIVLHGLDTADTHHTANSFTLGPGGGIYMQEGVFHHTQVETPWGPTVRNVNAGVYRYDPRKQDFIVYANYPFANPHGHVFDRWGQDIIHDGTGAVPYHGAVISGRIDWPKKHNSAPPVYQRRTRPLPASEIVSSPNFPDEMQDELLIENVIGDLGILRYKISDDGSSFSGRELEPLLLSDDQNFRPVDLEFGPRGELFFTDWANPVIGHMQHNLRDPSRDQTHGRVFRIVYKDRPLGEPESIADQPLSTVLDCLKSPYNRTRYRARIELSGRPTDDVVAATNRWLDSLDPVSADYAHHRLEALWVFQQHNRINRALLEQLLASDDFRVRAAATRVLCYWRNDISDSASMMRDMALDNHPRVRLEASRAASWFSAADAVPILMTVISHPMDKYLDYSVSEALRHFDKEWKQEFIRQNMVAEVSDATLDYVMNRMTIAEVAQLPIDERVGRHLLFRPGVPADARASAIQAVAEATRRTETKVLVDALEMLDPNNVDRSVVYDLVRLLATRSRNELLQVRDSLLRFAQEGSIPLLRQIGLIGLMVADQDVESGWQLAGQSVDHVVDFCEAIPLIPDPMLQRAAWPKVAPLLEEIPAALQTPDVDRNTVEGRFVRIQLPGKQRTLTLAEVEVISNGINIARKGSATQSSTNHGGTADRAIDGDTNPVYSSGAQTHTRENTRDPWWEVDLGNRMPIEAIRVYNRQEGSLGDRLEGFTLQVLDENRQVVFEKTEIAAPKPMVEIPVGAISPRDRIRVSAMKAVASIPGHGDQAFHAIAKIALSGELVDAALSALERIPQNNWDAELAPQLVDLLLERIDMVPKAQRTKPHVVEWMQFAGALSRLLPEEVGRQVRAQLDTMGVQVVRIGTEPHRMSYDIKTIVTSPGKQLQIIFENTDMMPHNLVVTVPGAMQEVGELAEATSQSPDAIARGYVPQSNKILAASRLVQPGEQDRVEFVVPAEPGIYPYVCTYPGHWRRMFGSMIVVPDVSQYNAAPDEYLASQNLEIKDELLLLNARQKTEWTIADFDNAFVDGRLSGTRDLELGHQMFRLASCISCHKMDGEGYEIGPDLTTQLDPKWTSRDLLQHVLEPSLKIDDKYKARTFLLVNGETVTGIVVEEDDDVVKLVENPLSPQDVRTLDQEMIEDSRPSDVSAMPKGLLDQLTRDEILDLIGFIESRRKTDSTGAASGGQDN